MTTSASQPALAALRSDPRDARRFTLEEFIANHLLDVVSYACTRPQEGYARKAPALDQPTGVKPSLIAQSFYHRKPGIIITRIEGGSQMAHSTRASRRKR